MSSNDNKPFDAAAIRDFAAEMQASTGDDLGPLIWRDVQRLAESYMRLEAILYMPELPQRSDASGEGGVTTDSGSTDAPHRAYFESIHGDIYLWRIGEITAEQALEAIDEWMKSVESGMPQRDDGSGSPEESGATKPSAAPSVGTGIPHLDRACELLWQAGHPAIAESLQREVEDALGITPIPTERMWP